MRIYTLPALALIFSTPLFARTWTDVQGRPLEADYVSATEEAVVVKLADGKTFEILLVKLSREDQVYAREALRRGEPPAEDPDAAEKAGVGVEVTSEDDGGQLNWTDAWPDAVKFEGDPKIVTEKEDADAGEFVYSSENYRFVCDVRLSQSVVGTFADMFEATRLYCRAVPLALDGGKKTDGKYVIKLLETAESYYKAGGPPGSAGVFMGGPNIVMVPLSSLGVRKVGSGYMRDRDKDDSTLTHELTHQLTPGSYFRIGLSGWFSEGIAEYVATTPYRYGRFSIRGNIDEIVDYASAYGEKGRGGRALGQNIKAPSLKKFMLMPYSEFTGKNGNFNYGFALLMTTYFFHFDGEGDGARLKAALKVVRGQKSQGEGPDKILEALLDGRSFTELEEEISKAWGRKGIDIEFEKSEESDSGKSE